MLQGLLILLVFQFLGEVVVHVTGWPLPAAVIGMVLLLVALIVNAPFSQRVAPAAEGLIRHLGLLIFPLGVGVVLQWHLFADYLLALVVAVVFGTLLSMVVVALVMKALLRRTP